MNNTPTQVGSALSRELTAETYTYDELNRLGSTSMLTNPSGSNWSTTLDYGTNYAYDANGNLKAFNRNGVSSAQLQMDQLKYDYSPGTNQLTQVDDKAPDALAYAGQDIRAGLSTYTYDPIGNLTVDGSSGANITWNVYGKVSSVDRPTQGISVRYGYDAAGQRIAKQVTTTGRRGSSVLNTYYVRDAQGTLLAVYEQSTESPSGGLGTVGPLTLTEQPLYGAQRLGQRQLRLALGQTAATPGYYARALGQKRYELADHLGNVRAVLTDAQQGLDGRNGGAVPTLAAYYNYYAFGLTQPGRFAPGNTSSQGGYRYGFNGKEKDNNGEFGHTNYDYGFRIYNPGIARFLSMDPLTKDFAMLTPYQYASNTPLMAVDLDGLEAVQMTNNATKTTTILTNYLVPASANMSVEAMANLKTKVYNELNKQTFIDKNHKDVQGRAYKVVIEINFIKVKSLDEAVKMRGENPDRTNIITPLYNGVAGLG